MKTKDLALILMNIPSIGRERTKSIINIYKKNDDLYQLLRYLYPSLPINRQMIDSAVKKAESLKDRAEKSHINIFCFNDYHFPKQLRYMVDYPPILYVKGNINVLNKPLAAALVGSRISSEEILKTTEMAAQILIDKGFTIISGLALGCDTRAHMKAIKEQAFTIAVLASGPDIIYPRENRFLYRQILDKKGAVVSEYGPGIPPKSFRFVERDRIQSGLSHIILLMESRLKGGAMYTAFAALKQKKPLLVYNPGVFDDRNRGNQYFLENEKVYPFKNIEELLFLMKNMETMIIDCNRETDQLLFPYD